MATSPVVRVLSRGERDSEIESSAEDAPPPQDWAMDAVPRDSSASSVSRLFDKFDRQSSLNARTWSKMSVPVAIVLGISVFWVSTTELASLAQARVPHTSFFMLWFSTSFLGLFLLHPEVREEQRSNHYFLVRDSPVTLTVAVPYFLVLYLASNLTYVRALIFLPPASVTAVFSTVPAFVYVMSLRILKHPSDWVKALSVVVAILGVALTTLNTQLHSDDDGGNGHVTESDKLLGCILVTLSSMLAALYKVSFKAAFGNANPNQVARFLGLLGFYTFVLTWPAVLLLIIYSDQTMPGADTLAWVYQIAHALAALSCNFLINFGVARTYPLFISIGTVLGIPMSMAVDCVLRGSATRRALVQPLSLVGAGCILVAFCIMLWRDRQLGAPKTEVMLTESADYVRVDGHESSTVDGRLVTSDGNLRDDTSEFFDPHKDPNFKPDIGTFRPPSRTIWSGNV